MAEQYISIRRVLDNILEHPLLQDVTLERAVNYTIDFMRIVGTPSIFYEKTEKLEIIKHRAVLPCDYHSMIQVRDAKHEHKGYAFRYSTNSFHMDLESHKDDNVFQDPTYKIQGNYIYTSIEKGEIEIAYKAFLVDKDGYPMIPDNSSFTRALELYIKKQHFTILFDLAKISPAVLQNVQQEYAWAVGDCQTEFNRLSIDKAESFYNSWRTLIIRDTEHRSGFVNDGSKEHLKLQ